jgi:hypothetical protein
LYKAVDSEMCKLNVFACESVCVPQTPSLKPNKTESKAC